MFAHQKLETPELLEKIAFLQEVQQTHRPTSSAWLSASDALAPLFQEMASRTRAAMPQGQI